MLGNDSQAALVTAALAALGWVLLRVWGMIAANISWRQAKAEALHAFYVEISQRKYNTEGAFNEEAHKEWIKDLQKEGESYRPFTVKVDNDDAIIAIKPYLPYLSCPLQAKIAEVVPYIQMMDAFSLSLSSDEFVQLPVKRKEKALNALKAMGKSVSEGCKELLDALEMEDEHLKKLNNTGMRNSIEQK